MSVSLCLFSDRAVSTLYTATGENDRRPEAGDCRAQRTITFDEAPSRLVLAFITCKLNQYVKMYVYVCL